MADNDHLERANARADEVFDAMRQAVEAHVEKGATSIEVLEVARKAGLKELDERTLVELKIPATIYPHPWLPWYIWWPWRPLWCWWWRWHYPWYECCPYWWWRCEYWL